MPELPEVETTRRGIAPHLIGQTIKAMIIRQPRLRWPVPEQVAQLDNQKILGVERRGKYLLVALTTGWLIIHLGMSGRVCILTTPELPQKHDHIDMLLSNGTVLRYTDPRRFGAWLWCEDLSANRLLAHLGPEPLTVDFCGSYLLQRSRNKKILIKPWLMDNRLVVGVGNIYASESLFMAGIDPQRAAASLTEIEAEQLVVAIKTVLQQAIEQGGTTLRDFLQSDRKPGYFAQKLQVYGRKNQQCHRCGGKIDSIKMAQRNTFYCPDCQK